MEVRALGPGDRPDFIEGWHSLSGPIGRMDGKFFVVQKLIHLIDLSAQARDQLAESYRDFRVGCAVLALDDESGRVGMYFGGTTPLMKARSGIVLKSEPLRQSLKRAFRPS